MNSSNEQNNFLKQNKIWKNICITNKPFGIKPNFYTYAVLSKHVYKEAENGSTVYLEKTQDNNLEENHTLRDWKVVETLEDEKTGFYARIYINLEEKQIVLAYRGTKPSKWQDIWEDFDNVIFNNITDRHTYASLALDKLFKLADKYGCHASCTGHSLGATYASISTILAKRDKDIILPAVLFDSPGAKEKLQEMQAKYKHVDLDSLDIITFLSSPNLVNCINTQLGSVYRLVSNIRVYNKNIMDWFSKLRNQITSRQKQMQVLAISLLHESIILYPEIQESIKEISFLISQVIYTNASHSMDGILNQFVESTGNPKKHCRVFDWPSIDHRKRLIANSRSLKLENFFKEAISIIIWGKEAEYNDFWELVQFSEDYVPDNLSNKDQFYLKYKAHYETEQVDPKCIDERHLDENFATFLKKYIRKDPVAVKRLQSHPFINLVGLKIKEKRNKEERTHFIVKDLYRYKNIKDFLNSLQKWLNNPDSHFVSLDEESDLQDFLEGMDNRDINLFLENGQFPGIKYFKILEGNVLQINPDCHQENCTCSAEKFLFQLKTWLNRFPELPNLSKSENQQVNEYILPLLIEYLVFDEHILELDHDNYDPGKELNFIPPIAENASTDIKAIVGINHLLASYWLSRPYPQWVPDIFSLVHDHVEDWMTQYKEIQSWIELLPATLQSQWFKLYGKGFYERWKVEVNALFAANESHLQQDFLKLMDICEKTIGILSPTDRGDARAYLNKIKQKAIDECRLNRNNSLVHPITINGIEKNRVRQLGNAYFKAKRLILKAEDSNNQVTAAQDAYTNTIIKLITEAAKQATDALGPSPYPFTLVGLDEIARLQLTSDSIIKLGVLAPHKRALDELQRTGYLNTWLEFIHLYLEGCAIPIEDLSVMLDPNSHCIGTPTHWAAWVIKGSTNAKIAKRQYEHLYTKAIFSIDENSAPAYQKILLSEMRKQTFDNTQTRIENPNVYNTYIQFVSVFATLPSWDINQHGQPSSLVIRQYHEIEQALRHAIKQQELDEDTESDFYRICQTLISTWSLIPKQKVKNLRGLFDLAPEYIRKRNDIDPMIRWLTLAYLGIPRKNYALLLEIIQEDQLPLTEVVNRLKELPDGKFLYECIKNFPSREGIRLSQVEQIDAIENCFDQQLVDISTPISLEAAKKEGLAQKESPELLVEIRWLDHNGHIRCGCLDSTIVTQLFDENGAFLESPFENCNHLVLPITVDDQTVAYLKVYPEYPALQHAQNALFHRIGGETHPTRLMQLRVSKYYQSGLLWDAGYDDAKAKGRVYPVQISATAEEVFQTYTEEDDSLTEGVLAQNIDPYDFGKHVIFGMLVGFEDHKASNLGLVKQSSSALYKICAFDADHVFHKHTTIEPSATNMKCSTFRVNAKNILFCSEYMKRPIDQHLRQELLQLDPMSVLKSWMQSMISIHQTFSSHLEDNPEANLFTDPNLVLQWVNPKNENYEKTASQIPMFFPKRIAFVLYQQFKRIQEGLRNNDIKKTYLDLLEYVEPLIGRCYRRSIENNGNNSLEDRFRDKKNLPTNYVPINEPSSKSQHHIRKKSKSMWSQIQFRHETSLLKGKRYISKSDLPSIDETKAISADYSANGKGECDPSHVLHDLDLIKSKTQLIEAGYDALINQDVEPLAQLLKLEKPTRRQPHTFENCLNWYPSIREAVLKKIDWETTKEIDQRRILKQILASGEYTELNLRGFQSLTNNDLYNLAEQSPHLVWLDISNCPSITAVGINYVAKQCPELTHLKMNGTTIENLKGTDNFNYAFGSARFQSLKMLEVKQSYTLRRIDINAPNIHQVKIKDTPNLTSVRTNRNKLRKNKSINEINSSIAEQEGFYQSLTEELGGHTAIEEAWKKGCAIAQLVVEKASENNTLRYFKGLSFYTIFQVWYQPPLNQSGILFDVLLQKHPSVIRSYITSLSQQLQNNKIEYRLKVLELLRRIGKQHPTLITDDARVLLWKQMDDDKVAIRSLASQVLIAIQDTSGLSLTRTKVLINEALTEKKSTANENITLLLEQCIDLEPQRLRDTVLEHSIDKLTSKQTSAEIKIRLIQWMQYWVKRYPTWIKPRMVNIGLALLHHPINNVRFFAAEWLRDLVILNCPSDTLNQHGKQLFKLLKEDSSLRVRSAIAAFLGEALKRNQITANVKEIQGLLDNLSNYHEKLRQNIIETLLRAQNGTSDLTDHELDLVLQNSVENYMAPVQQNTALIMTRYFENCQTKIDYSYINLLLNNLEESRRSDQPSDSIQINPWQDMGNLISSGLMQGGMKNGQKYLPLILREQMDLKVKIGLSAILENVMETADDLINTDHIQRLLQMAGTSGGNVNHYALRILRSWLRQKPSLLNDELINACIVKFYAAQGFSKKEFALLLQDIQKKHPNKIDNLLQNEILKTLRPVDLNTLAAEGPMGGGFMQQAFCSMMEFNIKQMMLPIFFEALDSEASDFSVSMTLQMFRILGSMYATCMNSGDVLKLIFKGLRHRSSIIRHESLSLLGQIRLFRSDLFDVSVIEKLCHVLSDFNHDPLLQYELIHFLRDDFQHSEIFTQDIFNHLKSTWNKSDPIVIKQLSSVLPYNKKEKIVNELKIDTFLSIGFFNRMRDRYITHRTVSDNESNEISTIINHYLG